jgi:hypothetical protein
MTEKHVGSIGVDSAQVLILDPANLGDEAEYQRVVDVSLEKGAGEVWLRDTGLEESNHGVVIETHGDGRFPVYVSYSPDGQPQSIRIDLMVTAE